MISIRKEQIREMELISDGSEKPAETRDGKSTNASSSPSPPGANSSANDRPNVPLTPPGWSLFY